MGWTIAVLLLFMLLWKHASRVEEKDDLRVEEAAVFYSAPENRKLDRKWNLVDKHFINKHLHRDDAKHERHKRNQWPM